MNLSKSRRSSSSSSSSSSSTRTEQRMQKLLSSMVLPDEGSGSLLLSTGDIQEILAISRESPRSFFYRMTTADHLLKRLVAVLNDGRDNGSGNMAKLTVLHVLANLALLKRQRGRIVEALQCVRENFEAAIECQHVLSEDAKWRPVAAANTFVDLPGAMLLVLVRLCDYDLGADDLLEFTGGDLSRALRMIYGQLGQFAVANPLMQRHNNEDGVLLAMCRTLAGLTLPKTYFSFGGGAQQQQREHSIAEFTSKVNMVLEEMIGDNCDFMEKSNLKRYLQSSGSVRHTCVMQTAVSAVHARMLIDGTVAMQGAMHAPGRSSPPAPLTTVHHRTIGAFMQFLLNLYIFGDADKLVSFLATDTNIVSNIIVPYFHKAIRWEPTLQNTAMAADMLKPERMDGGGVAADALKPVLSGVRVAIKLLLALSFKLSPVHHAALRGNADLCSALLQAQPFFCRQPKTLALLLLLHVNIGTLAMAEAPGRPLAGVATSPHRRGSTMRPSKTMLHVAELLSALEEEDLATVMGMVFNWQEMPIARDSASYIVLRNTIRQLSAAASPASRTAPALARVSSSPTESTAGPAARVQWTAGGGEAARTDAHDDANPATTAIPPTEVACEQNRAAQKEISGGTFGAADSAPDHWLERIREKQALATLCAMPGLVGGALTTMMQDNVASQDRQSDSKEAGAKRATPSSGEDSRSLQELQRIKQRYEKESAGAVEALERERDLDQAQTQERINMRIARSQLKDSSAAASFAAKSGGCGGRDSDDTGNSEAVARDSADSDSTSPRNAGGGGRGGRWQQRRPRPVGARMAQSKEVLRGSFHGVGAGVGAGVSTDVNDALPTVDTDLPLFTPEPSAIGSSSTPNSPNSPASPWKGQEKGSSASSPVTASKQAAERDREACVKGGGVAEDDGAKDFRLLGELPEMRARYNFSKEAEERPEQRLRHPAYSHTAAHERKDSTTRRRVAAPAEIDSIEGGASTAGGPTQIKADLLCAINNHVMKVPVRSPYGHVYEQATIELWLSRQGSVCPMTGKPLLAEDLAIDEDVKAKITSWHVAKSLAANFSVPDSPAGGEEDADIYEF